MEGNSGKLNVYGRRVNGVSRDLMPRLKNEAHFTNENNQQQHKQEAEIIELNLGLSTNGRFGTDPSSKNLKRSSSVSSLAGDGGGARAPGAALGFHAPLARASSMPAEMEELWRRRRPGKELESARSMEARKKRMEKMKRSVRKKGVYLSPHGDGSGLHEDESGGVNVQFLDNGGGVVNEFENWVMGSQRGSAEFHVPQGQVMMKGANKNIMTRSSSSHQIPNEPVVEGPAIAIRASDNNRDEKQKLLKNALLDMPHVSTGRVEGILYRYRRAEELKIVCVCHGLFLSPAEFVRHGGGGDVAQPLKHIVVNPFPLFQV